MTVKKVHEGMFNQQNSGKVKWLSMMKCDQGGELQTHIDASITSSNHGTMFTPQEFQRQLCSPLSSSPPLLVPAP